MTKQTFEQWARANNFGDVDTFLEACVGYGNGLDGRMSKRSISAYDKRFTEMQARAAEAKIKYREEILKGRVIDPSGRETLEAIKTHELFVKYVELKEKVDRPTRQIETIHKFGLMTHLANGKLKKPYQRKVDELTPEMENAVRELNEFLDTSCDGIDGPLHRYFERWLGAMK